MQIVCVGLDYRTVPLAVREQLSFTPTNLAVRLTGLAADASQQFGAPIELAILTTCNRLEYYAASAAVPANALSTAVRRWIVPAGGNAVPELDCSLYEHSDAEAARHLAQVAAGLKSQVLGETQIQGQVSAAYQVARACGTAGPGLAKLFLTAVRAGKRARTETSISKNAISLSTVAVQVASQSITDLSTAQVLVIGAGEMASLAVQALRRRQARAVTITNRTVARAQALAARWHSHWIAFEDIDQALTEVDLVISATAAPEVILTAARVTRALQRRPDRPLVLVDLAVPRDIASEAGRLPKVTYFDLDTLAVQRLNSIEARQIAVQPVEAIIDAEVQRFALWLEEWAVRDVIVGLRVKADAIRRDEVERTLRHLPHLTSAERERIHALSKALFNRWLHEPTTRLKAQSGSRAAEYSAAIRDLFGLDGTALADG
jgi:glutamyl-tRNA reductase